MVEAVKRKSADGLAEGSSIALMEALQATLKLTLEEKAQLSEFLSQSMQRDIRQESQNDLSWQAFLDRTFGCLADDPVDLPERIKAREQN